MMFSQWETLTHQQDVIVMKAEKLNFVSENKHWQSS